MPFNIQGPELILIALIALIVIGPGKLPDVGAALGKSLREFRQASSEIKDSTSLEASKPATPPAAASQATQAAPPADAAPMAAPEPPPQAAPTSSSDPTPNPSA
jgi:TatA/E family protein of Tat protein translocase